MRVLTLCVSILVSGCLFGSPPELPITAQDPSCGEGKTLCGESCVDIQSDVEHCGSCDPCPNAPNAIPAACFEGTCLYNCEPGFTDDNEDSADGCEGVCVPIGTSDPTCDGIDDDCDGVADDEGLVAYFPDGDEDGFGQNDNPLESCEQPKGYVLSIGDCDDSDPTAFPGAPEICDGIIQDCDNDTPDEGIQPIQCNRLGVCDQLISCSEETDYSHALVSQDGCSDDVIGFIEPRFEPVESSCGDGEDNDCDGFTDCGDDDCNCDYQIFVTSDVAPNPNFDEFRQHCMTLGAEVDRNVRWEPVVVHPSGMGSRAWLSWDRRVVSPNGDVVALPDRLFENGGRQRPIEFDEQGLEVENVRVWSGSNNRGFVSAGNACRLWSPLGESVVTRGTTEAVENWLDLGLPVACEIAGNLHLFCISQPESTID